VWVERAHGEPRLGDGEPVAQRGQRDATDPHDPLGRHLGGHLAQRHVRRHQHDPEPRNDQHHHRLGPAGEAAEELGHSGERVPGNV